MTHLEALNYMIPYYSKNVTVSSCLSDIARCRQNQQRRPYALPDRPKIISLSLLFGPAGVFLIIGVILFIALGITGILTRYWLFGYVHYPAAKVGYFIISLFGGESASVVTVDFIREWAAANETDMLFILALIAGYAGMGLGAGILFSLIRGFVFLPSDIDKWKKRCVELTPEKFEEEEDERIEGEKKRQAELEKELERVKPVERTVNSLVSQLHIPSQYLNERSLTVLRGYMLNGRAYTVADAINCAIADQWRSEQAQINKNAARDAEIARDNAEEARYYAKRTYDELHR